MVKRSPDTLHSLFAGQFYKPNAPSCIYVARMKRFRQAKKIGMCQLPLRDWRWGDLEYGTIVMQPKAPRLWAWLAEQRVLRKTEDKGHRWCPPALLQKKWVGYTELRITPVDDLKLLVNGALFCLEEMGIHRYVERFFEIPEKDLSLFERWMKQS